VSAANAGGAFSPFGDITTLMVWQAGKAEFFDFFHLFIPSIVNFTVPAALMHFAIPDDAPLETDEELVEMKPGALVICGLFVLTIATAVSFKQFLHLPPFMGMMVGLSFLMLYGYRLKMLFSGDQEMDVAKNPVVKYISTHMRVTKELHDEKFFVKMPDEKTGKMVRAATPLFLALVVINLADLVFAVDSVPAIFAITTDTFIVYTSNIMAILGLRALYFALAAMVHRFHYLKYALALVLVFIGSKIFVSDFLMDGDKFPPVLSLGVTFALILGGIGFSLWKTRDDSHSHVQH